jgi:transcriptional regulator with XRE-family HTH domain
VEVLEMDLGSYIKELRIRSGLSTRELARRSGVSQAYVSQIESGKKKSPSPEQLMKLAPPLGVDYMDLMKVTGYVMPDENFSIEEIQFLQEIEQGTPLVELIKHKPVIDQEQVTKSELEFAVDVIRSLRETKKKGN